MNSRLRIVIFGRSITPYRGLVRALVERGHDVLFLERDVGRDGERRDQSGPPGAHTVRYRDIGELKRRHAAAVRDADAVIVGSTVVESALVGAWVTRVAHGVTGFHELEAPVTLARLARGDGDGPRPDRMPRYHLHLSSTRGPSLEQLERNVGAPAAKALPRWVDPEDFYPDPVLPRWDLGYLGTGGRDRQRALTHLLMGPARRWWDGRFVVAGRQFPESVRWPANVRRIEHLPPASHREFYNAQRFTLNLAPPVGYAPSVCLLEAAACGTPVITDGWEGIETLLTPGAEILVARNGEDVLGYLRDLPEAERSAVGERARARVLASHTAARRGAEVEGYVLELIGRRPAAYISSSNEVNGGTLVSQNPARPPC